MFRWTAAGGKPWCCVLFAACLYVCLSLLVPGQYAATWDKCALLRWSGGGHQAAELGCGRLRRCPVIRPVTDRGMRDTPYDRCRTLTAAYRAGACLSLDDFPAVSSQRLLQSSSFLICAELISAVSRRWQVPRQNNKQKRRKNLPAVSASYDPSCVCSIVQFWWPPVFREAHFDILRVLSQSEKLLIAFHPCLLCSDLNA